MNCTQGDVAIITRPTIEANLGALVEVLRPWSRRPGWWWVRSLAGPLPSIDGHARAIATVADTALRPVQGALGFGEGRSASAHSPQREIVMERP